MDGIGWDYVKLQCDTWNLFFVFFLRDLAGGFVARCGYCYYFTALWDCVYERIPGLAWFGLLWLDRQIRIPKCHSMNE